MSVSLLRDGRLVRAIVRSDGVEIINALTSFVLAIVPVASPLKAVMDPDGLFMAVSTAEKAIIIFGVSEHGDPAPMLRSHLVFHEIYRHTLWRKVHSLCFAHPHLVCTTETAVVTFTMPGWGALSPIEVESRTVRDEDEKSCANSCATDPTAASAASGRNVHEQPFRAALDSTGHFLVVASMGSSSASASSSMTLRFYTFLQQPQLRTNGGDHSHMYGSMCTTGGGIVNRGGWWELVYSLTIPGNLRTTQLSWQGVFQPLLCVSTGTSIIIYRIDRTHPRQFSGHAHMPSNDYRLNPSAPALFQVVCMFNDSVAHTVQTTR